MRGSTASEDEFAAVLEGVPENSIENAAACQPARWRRMEKENGFEAGTPGDKRYPLPDNAERHSVICCPARIII